MEKCQISIHMYEKHASLHSENIKILSKWLVPITNQCPSKTDIDSSFGMLMIAQVIFGRQKSLIK